MNFEFTAGQCRADFWRGTLSAFPSAHGESGALRSARKHMVGAILLIVGLIYCIRYNPNRA
jgi:hypothetical protein